MTSVGEKIVQTDNSTFLDLHCQINTSQSSDELLFFLNYCFILSLNNEEAIEYLNSQKKCVKCLDSKYSTDLTHPVDHPPSIISSHWVSCHLQLSIWSCFDLKVKLLSRWKFVSSLNDVLQNDLFDVSRLFDGVKEFSNVPP